MAINHFQEEYCHDLKLVLGSNHNFIQFWLLLAPN